MFPGLVNSLESARLHPIARSGFFALYGHLLYQWLGFQQVDGYDPPYIERSMPKSSCDTIFLRPVILLQGLALQGLDHLVAMEFMAGWVKGSERRESPSTV